LPPLAFYQMKINLFISVIALLTCTGSTEPREKENSDRDKNFPKNTFVEPTEGYWLSYGPGVINAAKSARLQTYSPKTGSRYYLITSEAGVTEVKAWAKKHIGPLLNTQTKEKNGNRALVVHYRLELFSGLDAREDALLLWIPLDFVFPNLSMEAVEALARDFKAEEHYPSRTSDK
jgi:hypothetical protein